MNWFGFIRLMNSIFNEDLPDLNKIQRQGLLAVKIAQTFALRIDFLDREKCQHLAKLYRQAAQIPPEAAEKLIEKNTPAGWRDAFEMIDPLPLAAASIGQVHRGRLKTGEEVVIKLVKSDFREQFRADVNSVMKLLKLAIFFYPKLRKVADPEGILANISEFTLSELDLRNEIRHGEILRQIDRDNRSRFDLGRLRFPTVYHELSGPNVLVSEFIEGPTFDELLETGALDYDDLLQLFHIHGFYMFGVGTFHGDIHPGNLIFRDGAIYFIDTGALSKVGDRIRVGLFDFFEALSLFDYPACARSLNSMAEISISGERYQAFEKKFLHLYKDFTNSTVSEVSLTQKMMETIKLGVHSGMVFERGMFPIIKSLMYLDGMVLKCNPHAVLLKDMRRFIGEFNTVVKREESVQ